MVSSHSALNNYLKQYGQPCYLPPEHHQAWQTVLIVPICGEDADCLERLTRIICSDRFLIIVCLNRPDSHPQSEHWSIENNQLKVHLKQQAQTYCQLDGGYIYAFDRYDVWLLDFNQQPFKANHGVGLARKIAADSALSLIDIGVIKDTWIYSTDADVQLPADYFSTAQDNRFVAYSLAFRHVTQNRELACWQDLYDFKLKYYQQGMRYIGTPYDYIPLGSCLIIQAQAYANVRGFPKRSGGEDFYLLNKLAKLGPIAQPDKPILSINCRLSDRVPFGTGPALLKIKESPDSVRFYHPQIFAEIRDWYQKFMGYFRHQKIPDHDVINCYWAIDQVVHKAMRQIKTSERWQQFVLEWFDAFRLLKTVHALETIYPRLPLDELKKIELFRQLVEGLVVPE